ncbi:MAG: DNA repair protein RecN, partial [Bacteroidales bacterium]|nr:DNA repair protein RecN [Bacteroidales bacterium]
MLQHIHIENYTIIDNLSIDFEDGFSVITGETGAGKSILVGALSMLLGQRAETSVLYDKDKKCIVEAAFRIKDYGLSPFFEEEDLDYDETCIIRREITPQGKSRAFINDTPVGVSLLKKIGERLVDIHSQHSNLLLQNADFQLLIIDQYAGLQREIKQYKSLYAAWQLLKKQWQELTRQAGTQDKEYFEFLFNELDEAKLKESEQEVLEQQLQWLSHGEEIKQKLNETGNLLETNEWNALQLLQESRQRLVSLEKHTPELASLSQRLHSVVIELKDIAVEIAEIAEKTNYDPLELERIASRLDVLNRLEQKHKVTSDKELIAVRHLLSDKLQTIDNTESSLAALQEEIRGKEKELYALAENLSAKRRAVLPQIEKAIKEKLQMMNMPQAEIKLTLEKHDHATENGLDQPLFLFNANRGMEMQSVGKIASGGELSRLMLAVKSLVLQKNVLPTIIFDEIDMGVSGEVSAKMGTVMQDIARFSQVIAITHLPQIASKASVHYWVYKQDNQQKTSSYIKRLSQEERIVEIAKMISNEEIS